MWVENQLVIDKQLAVSQRNFLTWQADNPFHNPVTRRARIFQPNDIESGWITPAKSGFERDHP